MNIVEEIRKRVHTNPVLEKTKSVKISEKDVVEAAEEAGINLAKIPMSEILAGIEVEYEHGTQGGRDTNITDNEIGLTLKIAIAHLREIPDYYTRLAQMEREGKEAVKKNETAS
jgi:hypothetical protein